MTLFKKGKWKQLLCSACYSRSTARSWKCLCGAPWISCDHHAHLGSLCRTPHRLSTQSSKRSMLHLRAHTLSNSVDPPHPDRGTAKRLGITVIAPDDGSAPILLPAARALLGSNLGPHGTVPVTLAVSPPVVLTCVVPREIVEPLMPKLGPRLSGSTSTSVARTPSLQSNACAMRRLIPCDIPLFPN